MTDPVIQDMETMTRAAAIVQTALDDFEKCCSVGNLYKADRLRDVVHAALDAYMDAVASAHRRINDGN